MGGGRGRTGERASSLSSPRRRRHARRRHAVRSRAGAQPPSSSGWPCTVACDAHDPAPRLRAAPVPRLGRHADTAALGDGDGDGQAALCADTYVPRPPYRTCWLRAPVAQGSLLPGSHARYVPPYAYQPRVYRGTAGCTSLALRSSRSRPSRPPRPCGACATGPTPRSATTERGCGCPGSVPRGGTAPPGRMVKAASMAAPRLGPCGSSGCAGRL